MHNDQTSAAHRLLNWVVVRRTKMLLYACMAVSAFHALRFWRLGFAPVSMAAGLVVVMYLLLIFARRKFDEVSMVASCASIVVFSTVAIAFLGNGTGFEFYIFGVISAIFILMPGSGSKRYAYQLVSFLALAAARGLADNPYFEITQRSQEMFVEYAHDTWYINFVVAFATVISVSFFFAQSEEKSMEELEGIARTDELTALFNRHHTVPRLKSAEGPYSLAIIDIDDFKSVNDTFGHDAGDVVLRQVAQVLTSRVRSGDEVARWGGEEFLVMLPGCPLEKAVHVLEHMRESVARLRFEEYPDIAITISAGVCDRQERGWEEVVQEADRLLYDSKHSGKNVVTFPSAYTATAG